MTCGTDIVEIYRIKDAIEKNGDTFLNKIYTKNEIEYCESHNSNKYQHYAARFATKEAVSKALGTGFVGEFSWTEIEVKNDDLGRPSVVLTGKALELFNKLNMKELSVSISHCKEYAISVVVGY